MNKLLHSPLPGLLTPPLSHLEATLNLDDRNSHFVSVSDFCKKIEESLVD